MFLLHSLLPNFPSSTPYTYTNWITLTFIQVLANFILIFNFHLLNFPILALLLSYWNYSKNRWLLIDYFGNISLAWPVFILVFILLFYNILKTVAAFITNRRFNNAIFHFFWLHRCIERGYRWFMTLCIALMEFLEVLWVGILSNIHGNWWTLFLFPLDQWPSDGSRCHTLFH